MVTEDVMYARKVATKGGVFIGYAVGAVEEGGQRAAGVIEIY